MWGFRNVQNSEQIKPEKIIPSTEMPIKNRKSFEKKENKCIRLILDVGLVFLLFGGKKKKKKQRN